MPQESLRIEDQPGTQPGQRILRLDGALVMTTMFEFQATIRADTSRSLIIDFTNVRYVDSAGIGALVGAYVTRQHGGRNLALVGVRERLPNALKTQFDCFPSIPLRWIFPPNPSHDRPDHLALPHYGPVRQRRNGNCLQRRGPRLGAPGRAEVSSAATFS